MTRERWIESVAARPRAVLALLVPLLNQLGRAQRAVVLRVRLALPRVLALLRLALVELVVARVAVLRLVLLRETRIERSRRELDLRLGSLGLLLLLDGELLLFDDLVVVRRLASASAGTFDRGRGSERRETSQNLGLIARGAASIAREGREGRWRTSSGAASSQRDVVAPMVSSSDSRTKSLFGGK